MGFKTQKIAAVLIFGFILLFAVSALAWEQGSIKIVPSFKTEVQWDSNVFYDSSNEKDDVITILTPGIAGQVGFGPSDKHNVHASYNVDLGMFGKYHDQNYGNHDARGGVSLDFDEYTLNVDNRFEFTSSRAGTEFTDRILRKIDTLDTVLGFHFNKVDFELGYQFYYLDFLSDTLDDFDRYENSPWIAGYVQIAPKTKALLEFMYTNLQYPDDSSLRDGNAYRAMAGLKGDITAKLTGIAKAGVKYKDYEHSHDSDSDLKRKDFIGPVAYIALIYNVNDRMDIDFAYNREPFESIYENNNYYVGDHFLANLSYRFLRDFLAKLQGEYFHNYYPSLAPGETEKRRDNEWAVGPRLEYYWKQWLVAGVGYMFHQRESTIGYEEYDQHVVSGDIKVMF